ncbi:transmembrane 9 superfamily member 1-like [Corticium candelabrum]|uniref:transmembrane 9 superfamily member 1-like n=1 Tax=Corticium candelabrum TaxID=121492 RepID=UPI002E2597BF|nr:transmembrane 9 superfamily member 1-like [Corticium candelabrum]
MSNCVFHLLVLVLCLVCRLYAATYKDGDKVVVYVNKVGPYFNPHETYHYYSLPVCRPGKVEHKSLTLGEVLDGDRMAKSMYDIKFKENVDSARVLCNVVLKAMDIRQIANAVEELYYFEFVADDLSMRGFLGHLEETGFLPHSHRTYLWTHLFFHFLFNGNHVIAANVSTSSRSPLQIDNLEEPANITYSYTVKWTETKVKYANRATLLTSHFFRKSLEIHWLSVINSIILVVLLLGFVVIILMRVLRKDFSRYNVAEVGGDDEDLDQDGYGWKIIHADVFRFPPHKSLFCSILGVGSQFLAIGFGIILMALVGLFNIHRHGSINTAAVLLYALTSCIAGCVSSRMYKQIGGDNWVWNIVMTACLFSVPFFLIWSIVNSVAWYMGSTQALPYTTIIILMLIWLIVGFPLTVLGGIVGKNTSGEFDSPCRTKNIAREIPPVAWYRSTPAHMAIGGFLPFSAISVELYYIFATLWGRENYTLYGILLLVFIILLSVTACISIALTYFQLSSEDYCWWWRSLFSAGSASFYVFGYSLFYYYKRSNMSGVLQSVQFFGYTILVCYMFFLMLATVSFSASLQFIRYIYSRLKMD